jgi:P-type Mg2+ transporter
MTHFLGVNSILHLLPRQRLDAALDVRGHCAETLVRDACLNAQLQTGLSNPLDQAIIAQAQERAWDISDYRKIDEIPY